LDNLSGGQFGKTDKTHIPLPKAMFASKYDTTPCYTFPATGKNETQSNAHWAQASEIKDRLSTGWTPG
jgi:hypothetical protein